MKLTINIILMAAILLACNSPKDINSYLTKLHQDGKLN